AVGGDQRVDDLRHAAAGQVMGLQLAGGDVQAGFDGADARKDDDARIDLPQPHADQVHHADPGAGEKSLNPQVEELGDDEDQRQGDEHHDADDDPEDEIHDVVIDSFGSDRIVRSALSPRAS